MKKKFKVSFLALLAAFLMPAIASAHDFEVNGIYYNITSDSEAAVSFRGDSYNSYSDEYTGAITIPEKVTYSGTVYSVTSIGESAFNGCSGLTSVSIPNSVTSISDGAFAYCSGLTGTLTIPSSVTSIGEEAFYGCYGLIGSLTIPNSVTSIGEEAFEWCSGLTELSIGNSLISIGYSAFFCCSGLTGTLTIPNSVTYIGTSAFQYCTGLTSVSIPISVTSISDYAFAHCSGLTSVKIPNSVTAIYFKAFYKCSGLTELSIPNSVTSIGKYAFSDCKFNKVFCEATTPPVIGELKYEAFSEETYDVPLFVPSESIPLYKEAYDWKDFKNISAIDGEPGGIDEVEIDADTEVEVYTVSGVLIYQGLWSEARLSKGLYIVRQGSAARKILISE